MNANAACEIVFPNWYDEPGMDAEFEAKGFLPGVELRFPSGETQSLFFYDPVRLAQDIDEDAKTAETFVAFPGLIVVQRITRLSVVNAVNKLVDEGYFPIRGGKGGNSLSEVFHDARIDTGK